MNSMTGSKNSCKYSEKSLTRGLLRNTAHKFTQNVKRHTLTCVSNNIIQHYQPLKLWLQLLPDVLWQRFCLKAPQPVICLTVTLHEQLKWAHLETSSMKHNLYNENRSYCSVYSSKNIRSLTVLQPSFHTYKAIDKEGYTAWVMESFITTRKIESSVWLTLQKEKNPQRTKVEIILPWASVFSAKCDNSV